MAMAMAMAMGISAASIVEAGRAAAVGTRSSTMLHPLTPNGGGGGVGGGGGGEEEEEEGAG